MYNYNNYDGYEIDNPVVLCTNGQQVMYSLFKKVHVYVCNIVNGHDNK